MNTRWTQDKRLWLGGGALLALLIVLFGWFLVIEPQLSAASATRVQAGSIQTQNLVLEARNSQLKLQNDNIATLRTDLAAAMAELPSDGGLAEFTRQLSAQATATSVVLNSVAVGAATPVAGIPGSGSDSGTSGSGTADTAESETSDTGGTGGSQPASTAAASSGVVQMTITVTATGLGADIVAYIQAIQMTGPRRALVTASQLAPAEGSETGVSGLCNVSLTLDIFSAPLTPEDQVALEKLLSGG
jgi:hypothetical protein